MQKRFPVNFTDEATGESMGGELIIEMDRIKLQSTDGSIVHTLHRDLFECTVLLVFRALKLKKMGSFPLKQTNNTIMRRTSAIRDGGSGLRSVRLILRSEHLDTFIVDSGSENSESNIDLLRTLWASGLYDTWQTD